MCVSSRGWSSLFIPLEWEERDSPYSALYLLSPPPLLSKEEWGWIKEKQEVHGRPPKSTPRSTPSVFCPEQLVCSLNLDSSSASFPSKMERLWLGTHYSFIPHPSSRPQTTLSTHHCRTGWGNPQLLLTHSIQLASV